MSSEEIANQIFQDGKLGEFVRGDLGAYACDDPIQFYEVSKILISKLHESIQVVQDNNWEVFEEAGISYDGNL